jgi:hypothetical protein
MIHFHGFALSCAEFQNTVGSTIFFSECDYLTHYLQAVELEANWAPPEYPKSEAEVARLQVQLTSNIISNTTISFQPYPFEYLA